jgi:membrane protein
VVATVSRSAEGVALESGGLCAGRDERADRQRAEDERGEAVEGQRVRELAVTQAKPLGSGYPARMAHAASRTKTSKDDDPKGKRFGRSDDAPENPTDLPKEAFPAIFKRTVKQFSEDQLTTWAAALTYFGVLSLFPMLLALVSLLGVIGPSATQPLLDNLSTVAPGPAKDILTNVLNSLEANQGGSTVALLIGLAAAIWSASGYISAFMDASNNVWDAPEGRPIWKKIPVRLGVTVVLLVLLTATALAVVFTGPVAQKAGDIIGLGSTFVDVWSIVKWPVLLLIVSFMISLLYWACPNVTQPGFPWVTPGGLMAVVLWLAASALFALYVANFSSYNKTYGSLGGVIVFLVWLWITNIIVLLGAELNSEMERSRQIRAGHPPDEEPYLPLRDEPNED